MVRVTVAAFADVIITGRVVAVTTGWDSQVNTIYTYVTVDVTEVLKSDIPETRITIKQLGGVAGGFGLSITDQATFIVGEEVLLYSKLVRVTAHSTPLRYGRVSGRFNLSCKASGLRFANRRASTVDSPNVSG